MGGFSIVFVCLPEGTLQIAMEKLGIGTFGNFASRRRQVAPPAEDGRSFKFNKQLGMETQEGPKEHGDG